jgi:hypothetical protein
LYSFTRDGIVRSFALGIWFVKNIDFISPENKIVMGDWDAKLSYGD